MAVKPLTFTDPAEALRALAERLAVVGIEKGLGTCTGRVLAEDVIADRDSPAADVSAMDGYAIRLADLQAGTEVTVSGESTPGSPPPTMSDGQVVRIFTGAIVPSGADAVVKREDTDELDGAIRFRDSTMSTVLGENIRRAGENAKADAVVLSAGVQIHAAGRALMTNFGCFDVDVFLQVRVSIITTGDEVGLFAKERPQPWQLRNSNRVALASLLQPLPWITVTHVDHCADDRQSLTKLLSERLEDSDAILLTGGVSMGDYDHVPDCCRDVGGDVVFHGLPIRPGKPILGAATASGKLILGLPGNPVSATVGCRRFAMPLLGKLAGTLDWQPRVASVVLREFGDKTLPLYWFRLVRLSGNGIAEIVESQGSGDLVSLGHSDGFIECPPQAKDNGPWPYFAWA